MDSHTRPNAIGRAILLAALGGCGGSTVPVGESDSSTRPPTNDDASVRLIGQVFDVPTGDVYLGNWVFDIGARAFHRPSGCVDTGKVEDMGNRRLSVPSFWLHAKPVTNAFYGACVASGGCTAPDHDIGDPNPLLWDNPARFELPVSTRYDQAEAYCRWAGGRLPSMAEVTRAAQGDAQSPGIQALTKAAIACFTPGAAVDAGEGALCDQLRLMNFADAMRPALYRVGGVDLDRGPFGHADLFGSVFEWSLTMMDRLPGDKFCALAEGSPDFVTFETLPTLHFAIQFAVPTIESIELGSVEGRNVTGGFRVFENFINRYYLGFRCAFDALPR